MGGTGVSPASYHLHCLPWPSTDPGTLPVPPRASGWEEGERRLGDTFALGPVTDLHGLGKSLPLSEPLTHSMGRGCVQLGSLEAWASRAAHRPRGLTLLPSPRSSLSVICIQPLHNGSHK